MQYLIGSFCGETQQRHKKKNGRNEKYLNLRKSRSKSSLNKSSISRCVDWRDTIRSAHSSHQEKQLPEHWWLSLLSTSTTSTTELE